MALADLTIREDMATNRDLPAWLSPYRLLGFGITTLVPAVLWPLTAYGVADLFGYSIAFDILALSGLGIFAFLAAICSGILTANDSHLTEELAAQTDEGTLDQKQSKCDKHRAA